MKLREIYRSPKYYTVCESDRSDGLVLHLVAGGVLQYSVVVALRPEEERTFREDGHLDDLARDILADEGRYRDRTLRPAAAGETLEFVDRL